MRFNMAAPNNLTENSQELLELEEISLDYEGYIFKVCVDSGEARRLLSDPDYATKYSRMLVENMGQRAEVGVPPNIIRLRSAYESSISSNSPMNGQIDPGLDTSDPLNESTSEFKWTHNLSVLLISTRGALDEDFRSSKRKKKLWQKISEKIKETSGITVSGDMCDSKWRNLLGRYRKIKDKSKDTGRNWINWEYFDLMDSLLGEKACSAPPPECLILSMPTTPLTLSTSTDTSRSSTPITTISDPSADLSSEDISTNKSTSVPQSPLALAASGTKKRKAPAWLEQHQKNLLEAHEKMWKEQKEIDMEKIRAFNRLTDVIEKFLNK